MLWFYALFSGLAGASTLTTIHQAAQRLLPNAPRMDVLGMRAIARSLRAVDQAPPPGQQLYEVTLVGDLLANSLYYSLVGVGRPQGAPARGAGLGLLAGLGAVALPGPLGLGQAPSNRTPATTVMTIAWYLLGGLAAGLVYRLLDGSRGRSYR
jgi:hypothetical protein